MNTEPLPNWNRRRILAALGAAGTSVLSARADTLVGSSAFPGQSSGLAQGLVIEQGSGLQRGISNVMVSNGREVVLTDAAGRWSLPAVDGSRIFVIKPAHFDYLTGAGIPAFSKVFDGSQRAQSPIVFRLKLAPEPKRFNVLLFADTQPDNILELDYVRRELLAAMQMTGARFAIHHGDAVGDDIRLLPAYRDILDQTGLTWHHCPGNHDIDSDAVKSNDPFQTWRHIIGPTHYAFQSANATFFVLNNVAYDRRAAQCGQSRPYSGRIGTEQLAFIKNVLAHTPRDQLVVVSMHIPLASIAHRASPADTTADADELLQILAPFPHAISFSGHAHATEHHYLDLKSGAASHAPHHHHVLTAFCGSWWSGPLGVNGIPDADSCDGSPRGYHILEIDGHSHSTRFVPSLGEPARQIRAGVYRFGSERNGRLQADDDGQVHFLVNVFDGGPRTRVYIEILGNCGTLIELSRTAIADPYVSRLFAENCKLLKPWVSASLSSHIWMAQVPSSISGRTYQCRVRVVGEYGTASSHDLDIEFDV